MDVDMEMPQDSELRHSVVRVTRVQACWRCTSKSDTLDLLRSTRRRPAMFRLEACPRPTSYQICRDTGVTVIDALRLAEDRSFLHAVNLIVFILLLAHPILRLSPHHSHHLRSHHLSLPLHYTPDLKLISFTNPFLHSHSYSSRTDFTDLNLYCIKGALALFVLVSFSGYVC